MEEQHERRHDYLKILIIEKFFELNPDTVTLSKDKVRVTAELQTPHEQPECEMILVRGSVTDAEGQIHSIDLVYSIADLEERFLKKHKWDKRYDNYRVPTIDEFVDGFEFVVYSEGLSEDSIEDFWGYYKYTMGKNNWRDIEDIENELKFDNIKTK